MEYKVNQRSDEWHKLRKNVCLTASQFGDAVGVGLGKPFDFFKSLVSKDKDADDGQNDSEHIGDQSHWMEQGRRMEVVIREAYELLTGNKVVDSGFWVPQEDDPMHGLIGASPDGLVVDGSNGSRILGLVEFKAPAHNLFNKSEKAPGGIPRRYMVQMQGQMAVCGAAWCDFMAVCTKTRQVMLKRVFFQSRYWSHVSSALKQFCFAMQEAEIMQELGRDITGGPFAVQIHRQRMHDSPFPAEDIITVQNLLTCISSTLFRGPSRKLLSFDVLVGSHYVLPGSLNKYAQDLLTKVDAELGQKLSVKLSATNDGGDGDIQRIVFCGDASVAEEIAFPDSPDRIFEDAVCLFQSQDDLEVVVENCNKGKSRGPEDKVHLKETGSEEQTSAQTQDEENSLQGDKSESSPQRVSSVETSFQPAADQNADRVQASFSNSSGAKVLATSFAPAEAPTVRKIRRPGQMEAHKPASARSLPATSSATDTQPTASVPPTLQATETGSQEKGRLSQVPGSLSQVTRILSEIVETPSQVTSSQILGTSTQSTGMPSQVPRKSSQLTETSSQAKEALSSDNLPTFADQTGMATTAAAGTTATVGTAAAVGTKRSAKDEWDAAAAGRSLLKTAENFALTKAAVVSAASGCTQSSVPLASDSALIQSGNVAPPVLREESAMAVSDFVVLPDFPAPVIAITFQTATELSALKDPGQMMSDKMATSTTSDSLSEAKEVSAVGERQIEKEGGSQAQATNVSSLDADNINPGLTLVSKSDPETTTTVHSPGDKDMRQTKSDLPLKEDTSASEVGNVSECSKTWSVQVLTVDSVVEKSLKRPFTQRANTPEGEAKKLKEERVPIFTSHLPRESLDDAVPAFGQRRTSSEERGPAKDQMHRPWLNRLEGRSLQQVPFRDTDISFGRPSESERAAGTFRGPDDAHIPSLLNIRVDGGGNQRSLQYDRDSERSRATIDRCYHPGKTFDHQHIVVEEDFIRRMNPNFDHRMPGFLRDFEGHRRSHMDHLGQPSHRDLRNLNFLGVEVAGGMRQEMGQTSERRREGGGSSRLDGQSEFLPREVEPNRSGWVRPSGPQWQQSLRLTLRHQQPIDFGGLRPTWVGSQQPPDNFLGVRRPLLSQRDFPESRERLAQRGNEGDYRPDSTRNNGFRGFPPGRRPDF